MLAALMVAMSKPSLLKVLCLQQQHPGVCSSVQSQALPRPPNVGIHISARASHDQYIHKTKLRSQLRWWSTTQFSRQPAFRKEVVLEHSLGHLFLYHLWLPLLRNVELSS